MARRTLRSLHRAEEPAKKGQCPLLDLPVELVAFIVEDLLEDADRVRLRATCRTFESLTTSLVAEWHFTDRSFILSDRNSMEAFRQITDRREFAKSFYRVRLTNGIVSTDNKPTKQRMTRGQLRNFRVEQQSVADEQRRFRAGEDIDCLRQIFTSFMEAGNTPAVICTGNELPGRSAGSLNLRYPVGYRSLQKRLGGDECLDNGHAYGGLAYAIIHDALIDSGFPVQTLEMGTVRVAVPLTQYSAHGITTIYRNLRSLVLHLTPEQGYSDDDESDQRRARDLRGFVTTLSAAQNIRTLKISMDYWRYPVCSHSATFAAIADARARRLILPHLQILELSCHSIKLPTLLDFIRSYSGQLWQLKLWHIRDGGADYPDLSDRIYETLSIPESLSRTRNHPYDEDHFREWRGCLDFSLSLCHCYNGPEWIEWDRAYSCRTLFGFPEQEWPRPWPEIEL